MRARREADGLSLWLALAWVAVVVAAAVLAGALPLRSYGALVPGVDARTPPGWRPEFLGTDAIGRSVLARVVHGARESLLVGIGSAALAMAAGLATGLAAGYFRRWVDTAIGVVLDAVLAVPALVLLIAVAAVGRRGTATIVLGLAVVGTPSFARLARASTLAVVDREYVAAARALGTRPGRILRRELLPEVVLRLAPFAFVFMAFAVVAEASLSFLGLGLPPPAPSWGGMINDGRPYLDGDPFLVFVPAVCVFLTVASFTVIGERARRRFDARESRLR
ncbi:ABC transporter permease [Parafrankia colletiae]|uniref:ABC transporter permease n=1 Tax=Parafrankia colletiae TaxID=573497 RepID=A0A1S1R021_9ACTN|nr:ABC transporter permease [Parafrankia colletiae]MCK9900259.1 ABC transporter permease [Frankia sp. Cpl3]OHV40298.1 ABC transporter permease [Parafrankia colletiae]